jgi:DNA-directed RNA polymerase subunit F
MLHIIGFSCLLLLSSKLLASQQYGARQPVSVENLIAAYAAEKQFSPLPSQENPVELHNFIGPVDRLITVGLATLPTLFSHSEVVVVDNRAAQLRFSSMLHTAFLKGTLEGFSKGIEEGFIAFHQENIQHPSVLQRVFESIYRPLKELSPLRAKNIQTKIANILEEDPLDCSTIFISTMLELDPDKLEENLNIINRWSIKGHTVVFSLTTMSNHEYIINKLQEKQLAVRERRSANCGGTIYYKI